MFTWKIVRDAGNRAHANWAIGLSSTVAANLAARCGGGAVPGLAPLDFTNLAAGSPPLMVKMGACQVRGAAGPRTKHGVLAQLTQQHKGGVGLSQPHASLLVGPVCTNRCW